MKTVRWGALGAALAAAFASGGAQAESTYGYFGTGGGTTTATANLYLTVNVPMLILLRVGSASTTIDTLSWSVTDTIPAGAVAPVNGNNASVNWDGTAPASTVSANRTAVATAWTNANTATINCSATAVTPAGGPTLANFGVSAGAGTLPHPGANLGACASTTITSRQVLTSTWTYSLGGTPVNWSAGSYSSTVTYTASGI
jgi:hypothetical protein